MATKFIEVVDPVCFHGQSGTCFFRNAQPTTEIFGASLIVVSLHSQNNAVITANDVC
jgi:hypothetical protein